MKRLKALSRDALAEIVAGVVLAMYVDEDGNVDLETEWSPDTLDWIAAVLDDADIVPKTNGERYQP